MKNGKHGQLQTYILIFPHICSKGGLLKIMFCLMPSLLLAYLEDLIVLVESFLFLFFGCFTVEKGFIAWAYYNLIRTSTEGHLDFPKHLLF